MVKDISDNFVMETIVDELVCEAKAVLETDGDIECQYDFLAALNRYNKTDHTNLLVYERSFQYGLIENAMKFIDVSILPMVFSSEEWLKSYEHLLEAYTEANDEDPFTEESEDNGLRRGNAAQEMLMQINDAEDVLECCGTYDLLDKVPEGFIGGVQKCFETAMYNPTLFFDCYGYALAMKDFSLLNKEVVDWFESTID